MANGILGIEYLIRESFRNILFAQERSLFIWLAVNDFTGCIQKEALLQSLPWLLS